ncbi:MAG TPA: helical backbone metal receptor [Saprospiraceae bacterium]|jgi:ABC-type hemin transport system substrate-binding protein|nr:helical backbone metal receptor [Saprospiraceae bacterium]
MIHQGNSWTSLNDNPPCRIISLVPSLTELLYYLGLGKYVLGITRFCVLPETKIPKPKIIGGTKNPKIDSIRLLNPDFIIASKEENRYSDIHEMHEGTAVWVTDIATIEDNIEVINSLLAQFDIQSDYKSIVQNFTKLYKQGAILRNKRVLYLIWKEPYPFKQSHLQEFATIFPDSKIILVDGQMFSWYGIRPLFAMEYFATIEG